MVTIRVHVCWCRVILFSTVGSTFSSFPSSSIFVSNAASGVIFLVPIPPPPPTKPRTKKKLGTWKFCNEMWAAAKSCRNENKHISWRLGRIHAILSNYPRLRPCLKCDLLFVSAAIMKWTLFRLLFRFLRCKTLELLPCAGSLFGERKRRRIIILVAIKVGLFPVFAWCRGRRSVQFP